MSIIQKIFISGGTGLLGSHLITRLAEDPYNAVRALYRTSHPNIPNVEWVQGDILDSTSLYDFLQDIDIVYHCAGAVDFRNTAAQATQSVNAKGTANIVNASLDQHVTKFLFVSSVAAIGGSENILINETYQWNDKEHHSAYADSKYQAEMEVWRGHAEGLNTIIVNPSIILGAGDWTKGSTQVFQSVYNRFPWYTDGIHGYVDVLDVVECMVQLINEPSAIGERFILNADNISYKQLFDMIADGFGIPHPHKKVTKTMAAIVWRWKSLQGWLTQKPSLLTKETAHTAMSNIAYCNEKIRETLPYFQFRSLKNSITRITQELIEMHHL